ncbi:hypothetical protein RIF29_15238 [Crotalaria pallida]|uniref:Uncharacterized protein n=1 Tax=Crotalaria pallida TaxID=3830 RepID=A0AAN9FF94_CROPI
MNHKGGNLAFWRRQLFGMKTRKNSKMKVCNIHFRFANDLTFDTKNASSKPKPVVINGEQSFNEDHSVGSPMSANGKHESSTNGDYTVGDETSYAHSEDGLGRSPPDSPAGKTIVESLQEFSNAQFRKSTAADAETNSGCDESTWGKTIEIKHEEKGRHHCCKKLQLLLSAARETGALKEAKDKLEKCVEELTWRMQIEKRLRTDLEEEKTQEIAKLQDTLHTMQTQVEEANARVIKEREATKKAIEEAPPVIKETPVIIQDTEKINSLLAGVKSLKVGNLLFC